MDLAKVYLKIYIKVYSRFGSYIVGLGLGYILYKTRSYKVKMHVVSIIHIYIISFSIFMFFYLTFDQK